MNETLAEYIIRYLGNSLYDVLLIDPEDHDKKPASEFYEEIVDNCRIERPDIIEKYEREQEKLYYRSLGTARDTGFSKVQVQADFPLACRIAKDIIDHTGNYRLQRSDYYWLNRFEEPFLNMLHGRTEEELEDYLNKNSKKTLPNTNINCIAFKNKILWFAGKYAGQYKGK